MRIFLNQDDRVIPWLRGDFQPILNAYLLPLSQSAVLIGPNADNEIQSVLRKLPATPRVELVREYFRDKKLVFVDTLRNPSASETAELPPGLFPDLLEDDSNWSSILGKTQGALKPGEARSAAFERLLGKLVDSSQAIEILDPYLTCPLLDCAITDSEEKLFWLDKLLRSDASKVTIYSRHPSDRLLNMSDQCRGNERLRQVADEEHRLRLILDFLVRQKEQYRFKGSIEFRSTFRMPHDRYLRFGLLNGSVFIGLPKGIDPFEKDPLESVHKLFSLDKHDWKNVMDSPEWGSRDRTASDHWSRTASKSLEDGCTVSILKQNDFRSPFPSHRSTVHSRSSVAGKR